MAKCPAQDTQISTALRDIFDIGFPIGVQKLAMSIQFSHHAKDW